MLLEQYQVLLPEKDCSDQSISGEIERPDRDVFGLGGGGPPPHISDHDPADIQEYDECEICLEFYS